MVEQIQKLLDYQTIDDTLRSVEGELNRSDARKNYKIAKTFLDGAQQSLDNFNSRAELTIKDYNAVKLEYDKLTETESEYDAIINTCEDVNELNYINKKAQELLDNMSKLENIMTKLVEDINNIIKEYNKLGRDIKENKDLFKKSKEEYATLKASKDAEMLEIKNTLQKLEKGVDKELMAKYKEKRANKIKPPIVCEVKGGNFCGCGTYLNAQDVNKLETIGYTECEHCGKIVYKK